MFAVHKDKHQNSNQLWINSQNSPRRRIDRRRSQQVITSLKVSTPSSKRAHTTTAAAESAKPQLSRFQNSLETFSSLELSPVALRRSRWPAAR